MKHKNCGGHFDGFIVQGHGYCFMRCDKCRYVLGGQETQDTINRLMRTKVNPYIKPL